MSTNTLPSGFRWILLAVLMAFAWPAPVASAQDDEGSTSVRRKRKKKKTAKKKKKPSRSASRSKKKKKRSSDDWDVKPRASDEEEDSATASAPASDADADAEAAETSSDMGGGEAAAEEAPAKYSSKRQSLFGDDEPEAPAPKKKVSRPAKIAEERQESNDDEGTEYASYSGAERAEVSSEPLTHVPSRRRSSSSSSSSEYALQIAGGPKAFGRQLQWNDDLFERMVGYRVLPAFAAGVSAEWYPAAHFMTGFLTNVGILATYDTAFGLATRGLDTVYPTHFSAFDIGVQVRLPMNGWKVGALAALGSQTFAVKADGPRDTLPPDVAYGFIRAGLFGALNLSQSFELHLHAHYLIVNSTGMIGSADYFPRATAGGIDVGGGLDYRFSKAFGVGVRAGLRRYFFNMNSQPGDANVAGGAIDQYPMGELRISYRL